MNFDTLIMADSWTKGDVIVRVGRIQERFGKEFEFTYFLLGDSTATKLNLKEVKSEEEIGFSEFVIGGDHDYFYRRVAVCASSIQSAIKAARLGYHKVIATMMSVTDPYYKKQSRELESKLNKGVINADQSYSSDPDFTTTIHYGRVIDAKVAPTPKKVEIAKAIATNDEWPPRSASTVVQIDIKPKVIHVPDVTMKIDPSMVYTSKTVEIKPKSQGPDKVYGSVNPKIVCRTELEIGKYYTFWDKPIRPILSSNEGIIAGLVVRQKTSDGGKWKVDVVEVTPQADGTYRVTAK